MNKFEKDETLKWLERMHKKFGQEIAAERKNGASLYYGDIILDIKDIIKETPAREACHDCGECKYLKLEKKPDEKRICTKFDVCVDDKKERPCLYGEKRTLSDMLVVEECPDCGNEAWLIWDVSWDGYLAHCPYCGYRMMLCNMCDVRDGGTCDWDEKTGECKHNTIWGEKNECLFLPS